jgi:hypothetical protein
MRYPKPSELALKFGPIHSDILDSGSRRTNPAKLDKFIELLLISFSYYFHVAVRKVSNPARDVKPSC